MLRPLRPPVILIALIALLAAAEAWRERSILHSVDLREFDGAAAGKLDADTWRSNYERRPVRLFGQTVALLRTQYHMGPVMAAMSAYRAAHAAFVFKDGKSRTDYERALPDLERYYAGISALAAMPFDSREAARLELEWWILHREGSPELDAALAKLQSVIYHVPERELAEHAQLRATAMILRDSKGDRITGEDWERIGKLLNRSWLALYAVVNGKTLARRGAEFPVHAPGWRLLVTSPGTVMSPQALGRAEARPAGRKPAPQNWMSPKRDN